MKSTGIASQTRLPPSPELVGVNPLQGPPPALDLLSVDTNIHQNDNSEQLPRLKSIAGYESFQPQALACSPPILEYAAGLEKSNVPATNRKSSDRGLEKDRPGAAASSLGAVAGSDGVALFRLLRPQSPLMVLSHALHTSETKQGGAVSLLSFQPNTSRSLHLASSRGTGVLIWDVSGQSLSPLLGRLGMNVGSGVDHSPIVSLAWQPPESGSSSSSAPVLAAATEYSACIWDLRQHSSSATFRPSLRFGLQRGPNGALSAGPYVQIASARRDECAILDAAGVLRIYDMRMTDRTRRSLGALCMFSTLHQSGVGLSNMRTSSGQDCWVTWGLDEPGADAVVKVWSRSTNDSTVRSQGDVDDYWFMDTSPAPSSNQSASSSTRSYDLVGECVSRNLACARVCPAPLTDSIVTVGFCGDDETSTANWRANLWKLKPRSDTEGSRMECIVTFVGGQDVENSLGTMVGRESTVGAVCAAELALSSQTAAPTAGVDAIQSGGDSMSLLLCTLTEKGFIATHAIPEAIPSELAQNQERQLSPKREGPKVLSLPPSARLFPSDTEAAMTDAARNWKRPGQDVSERSEKRSDSERIEAPGNQASLEGAPLPFDMESPVYTKKAVMLGVPSTGSIDYVPNSVVSGPTTVDDNEQRSGDQADAAALMKNIETDRIPCPRLCGASFGSGVGGLAIFHNGDVKKVWSWWERNHPTRLSTVPGLIGEPAPDAPPTPSALTSGEAVSSGARKPSRDCPRTLRDLISMTTAAKAAQWGDQDDSDVSSAGFQTREDDYFEDDSEASSDSADEQVDDFFNGTEEKESSRDMYSHYFGRFQRPTAAVTTVSDQGSVEGDEKSEEKALLSEAVGASSDMLSPIVKVSFSYDDLALNRQSPLLAKGWKFADIDAVVETPTQKYVETLHMSSGRLSLEQEPTSLRAVAPTAHGPSITPSRMVSYSDDERGVHGGEYSVRPNMQESMVFLKKLAATAASKLRSPLDEPMLPQGLGKSGPAYPEPEEEAKTESSLIQPGVYVIEKAPVAVDVEQELRKTKEICLHNAEVSKSLDEIDKSNVWGLLAQMVGMRLIENITSLDTGATLTQPLVESLLRYYESLGDVQMLSTIICVLRKNQHLDSPKLRLLPVGRDEQYDMFIRRYAELLYGWGLLEIRAEATKHLVRADPGTEISQWAPGPEDDEGRVPGIGLVFSCPRCGGETEQGTNCCRSCQDYAFRCSICDNSVRGLFTVCKSCGHGGHMDHLREWFATTEDCPSGCGCKCMASRSQYANQEGPT